VSALARVLSVVAPGPAMGAARAGPSPTFPRGATVLPSSFGVDPAMLGQGFRAAEFFHSPRSKELAFRESFFRCEQHDRKIYDFDGRVIRPGSLSTQPFIGKSLPTFYVPLDDRRPSDPQRLARKITRDFTAMLYGEGTAPRVVVRGDPKTEDFALALAEAQGLTSVMARARNIGGATGTAVVSWRFVAGRPQATPHRPQFVHVHEWEDRGRHVVRHATQLYQVSRAVCDPGGGKPRAALFWYRRDWTPEADVFFYEAPVGKDDPLWVVDEEQTHEHGDGFAHLVWVPNVADTDETAVDGLPDYDGLYENLLSLDKVASVTTRGATVNLDPTLKLRMDPEVVQRFGVKKGSDNAIVTGKDGDADYMELSGSSIEVGHRLTAERRQHALEISGCVSPDPNVVAAAGTSGLAIRLLYRPMTSACNDMRVAYGAGQVRLLEQQLASARRVYGRRGAEVDDEGRLRPAREFVDLPYRVDTEDVLDPETGEPTGETTTTLVEREPGEGGQVALVWPDYFERTPAEKQVELAAIQAAAGGKALISHETAVEMACDVLGVDPKREWGRVVEEQRRASEREAEMTPGIGGGVSAEDELPLGAEPDAPASSGA